jgi:hypothetical protein
MATNLKTPTKSPPPQNPTYTIPSELIEMYPSILNNLKNTYTQTKNYTKEKSDSGMYLKSIDKTHHISFHPTIKNIKKQTIPHRIHIKYNDGYLIHLKLELNNSEISLVSREESKTDYQKFVQGTYIGDEITNINTFLKQITLIPPSRKASYVDKSKSPPAFTLENYPSLSGKNKYLEYKLKYLILKKFINKNN